LRLAPAKVLGVPCTNGMKWLFEVYTYITMRTHNQFFVRTNLVNTMFD